MPTGIQCCSIKCHLSSRIPSKSSMYSLGFDKRRWRNHSIKMLNLFNNYILNAKNLVCSKCEKLINNVATVAADCSAYCKTSSGKYYVAFIKNGLLT
jgi:hypothetical protein